MTKIVKLMNKEENGVEEQVYPQTHIEAVIGYEGGSGSGGVESVNGKTGIVVLTANDVGASATSHTHSADAITSGTIERDRLPSGTVDVTGIVRLHDALESASPTRALTANQGKVLNESKLDKTANAVSASKLQTARTITLSGAVTGYANFDGSSNVTINTTGNGGGVPAAHTHKMSDIDYLDLELDKREYVGHMHDNATTTKSGFMSSSDKTRFDNMATIRLEKVGEVK